LAAILFPVFAQAREKARPPTEAEAIQLGKARHSGIIDTLFVDGHVKAVAYDRLVQDCSMWVVTK
jgi:prepilin-type processing-associated H-X9-DG protein